MKKTKEQKQVLRSYKLVSFFWVVTRDKPEYMIAYNWLNAEFRMLEKNRLPGE